jgi:SpoVK/Ycf46/Vps4 family AAA+-type ATPase
LIDEFDAIAKLRNDPQEVGEIKRVVNTLLQNLDSRKNIGFTIGVTNHEKLLDPAIWRRFDVQLEIPKPSPEVMRVVIKKFLNPLDLEANEIEFLAWLIDESSGADAEMMVKWLKKAEVLDDGEEKSLVGKLKRFALLNSGRIDLHKRNMLAHSDEELAKALASDEKYEFKQKDIASLLDTSTSRMSKLLSKKQTN